MKTYRIALPFLVACLTLSACAGQDGDSTRTGGAAAPDRTGVPVTTPSNGPSDQPGSAATPPGAVASPSDKPGGPGASPAAGGTTLTGTITSGVEPGCLLLGEYLLVGGPRDRLTSGGKVTVTGKIQPDLMTTCQQGIPFMVETVKPA